MRMGLWTERSCSPVSSTHWLLVQSARPVVTVGWHHQIQAGCRFKPLVHNRESACGFSFGAPLFLLPDDQPQERQETWKSPGGQGGSTSRHKSGAVHECTPTWLILGCRLSIILEDVNGDSRGCLLLPVFEEWIHEGFLIRSEGACRIRAEEEGG